VYNERVPTLREELLELQQTLRSVSFPVVVVFSGVDGAGKGETVNLLNEWMDPRWLITRAYTEPSQEEAERPEFWRYWRDLPPAGRIGLLLRAWYSKPVLDLAYGNIDLATFDDKLDRINAFEKALADDGALIIKFWMHLGRDAQKKRLKALEKDPLLSWRVTDTDWHHWRMYDAFVAAAERTIMRTSIGHAPWHIVEGLDPRYRSLTVGTLLRDAIRQHMAHLEAERRVAAELQAQGLGAVEPLEGRELPDGASAPPEVGRMPTVLSALDMGLHLGKEAYETGIKRYQSELNLMHRQALRQGISTLVVFEGWDAAGKGGSIRRCTAALDARHYEVIPFAAPTDEERVHHYLWRFWRRLGRAGRVTFFDRSWYGRVLVERVEGFATDKQWMRAYAEINDFEEQLVEYGIVLVKFWLHITPEEQLARFQQRAEIPWKRWKLSDEDWRNRDKWDLYEHAVNDMIARTSTRTAPWTLVEANDKRYTRVKVLQSLCERLAAAVGKPAANGKTANGKAGTARPGPVGGGSGKASGKKGTAKTRKG
jgi:polyphosphate:AMP phosphotransferase